MEALWASVIAVVGTLLGSVVTHTFQRLASRRAEEFSRAETLRRQRVDVYSGFASAVEDYRRGQSDRWYRMAQDPHGDAFWTARGQAHVLRTAARQALYQVRLVTAQSHVTDAAERAYRRTQAVSEARTQEQHDAADLEARRSIEAFVTCAAPLVR